ncbi:hypothetical protein SAMN06295879_1686 [Agreia bicolorata]|uniref:Uncharacterized protein n=1 Tax=Agreia bicolorata TaxID=110935 RepID=A0A1T4XUZ1_9MICO|nr:hypothetical protein [Agreia bicolorata]SKA93392.1 hypothetical protein SAMN06295879_1686 [Agreia bicolorata]
MTSSSRPTAAELDPVSRVTARMFAIAMGVVSVALSIALSLTPTGREQISLPVVAILAQLVLAASYVYFIRAANPFGRVVSFARFQVFLGGVMLASVLDSLSQFGSNTLIRDDWGAVCLGLALLLAGPYRRSTEIVWFTLQAVALTFSLAFLQNLSSETATTLSILALIAATPSIAIGLASAAYARSLVASLEKARDEAQAERVQHQSGVLIRLAETDAMGELGSLRRDVLPFLARLDESKALQPGDAVRATELASELRRAIVDRISRGTLEDVVDRYSDDDGVAAHLDERQISALRALIGAMGDQYGTSATQSLTLERRGADAWGRIEFTRPAGASAPTSLAHFLRMVRLVFDEADARTIDDALVVTFRFDSPDERAALSWEM